MISWDELRQRPCHCVMLSTKRHRFPFSQLGPCHTKYVVCVQSVSIWTDAMACRDFVPLRINRLIVTRVSTSCSSIINYQSSEFKNQISTSIYSRWKDGLEKQQKAVLFCWLITEIGGWNVRSKVSRDTSSSRGFQEDENSVLDYCTNYIVCNRKCNQGHIFIISKAPEF
jgi:hypothetical protein